MFQLVQEQSLQCTNDRPHLTATLHRAKMRNAKRTWLKQAHDSLSDNQSYHSRQCEVRDITQIKQHLDDSTVHDWFWQVKSLPRSLLCIMEDRLKLVSCFIMSSGLRSSLRPKQRAEMSSLSSLQYNVSHDISLWFQFLWNITFLLDMITIQIVRNSSTCLACL